MSYDEAALSRMLDGDADSSNRHRVRAVIEYLDIRTGDTVLDCGCGLGWFLKVIGHLYDCRPYGADVDRSRLLRAARELGATPLVTASASALPFASDTFDKVILSEVLEHLAADLDALVEVRRVLKPGGVAAITVPNRRYPFCWDPVNFVRESLGLSPIRRGLFGGIWTNHLRLYGHEDILDLARRAQFVVEDSRTMVCYCLPFAHNLVYGLGKPLVESGMFRSADRFRFNDRSNSPLSPLTWFLKTVGTVDKANAWVPRDGEPAVSIAVKVRKP